MSYVIYKQIFLRKFQLIELSVPATVQKVQRERLYRGCRERERLCRGCRERTVQKVQGKTLC